MKPWNPWESLRVRPDITLHITRLLWPNVGRAVGHPGDWHISLDDRLDRVHRRCTLAHELVHVERGIVAGPSRLMEREEQIVRAETARRLVPLDELTRTVARMASIGVGVEVRHVADFYDVTPQVAHDALLGLTRAVRAA